MSRSCYQGVLQFLGTGPSTGVPVVGCRCSVCVSDDPRNHRLRSSVRVCVGEKLILIDASPDFRQQALKYHITMPDALCITHTHYDHIGGLEELRVFNFQKKKAVPCFLSDASFLSVQKLFYYHFSSRKEQESFAAEMDFHVLSSEQGTLSLDEIDLSYFSYWHGSMPVTGWRIGELGYVTDIKQYDPVVFEALSDIEVLIIGVSCFGASRTQMTIEEALEFREKVGAKRTYFTHLSHDIDYARASAMLPEDIRLAYDGLEVQFMVEGDEKRKG